MAYELNVIGTVQQNTNWMKFLKQQPEYELGIHEDAVNIILQNYGARTVGKFYSKIEFDNEEDAVFFKLKWGF